MGSAKSKEVWEHLSSGGASARLGESLLLEVAPPWGRSQAYVCTAALVKVSRSPVREHLFNYVAPAPAPKHSLPVLVAHILREGRTLEPEPDLPTPHPNVSSASLRCRSPFC